MVQLNKKSILVNSLLTVDSKDAMKMESSSKPPEAPTVVNELEDCHVEEGEAGLFKFCVSAFPPPNIEWYFNDQKVEESRQFTLLVENDQNCCANMFRHILVVTRCDMEFSGRYTAEVSNSEGTVRSSANLCLKTSHVAQRKVSTYAFGTKEAGKQPVEVKKEKAENYYTFGPELGRGKFGVVYKCVDKVTNVEYAAKVSKCRSPSQRKIVLNEIDILNQLSHPLICHMDAAFEHSKQYTLILELVCGGELFERLMEEELISEMDVTYYVKQLLRAINYIHGRGILHLDLKPENIMLVNKSSTQIKLIDFSLACRVEEGDSTKIMAGTREFVSPEVINYDPVSPATDMWAVGVITYVLLASFTPFAGETDSEISSSIMRCDWSCDDDVFEDISEEAKDFIATLIVKEPERRATSEESLEHPWFRSITSVKKIKTARLISFLAKKNWRKTIAAVRTATFLNRITKSAKESKANDTDEDKVETIFLKDPRELESNKTLDESSGISNPNEQDISIISSLKDEIYDMRLNDNDFDTDIEVQNPMGESGGLCNVLQVEEIYDKQTSALENHIDSATTVDDSVQKADSLPHNTAKIDLVNYKEKERSSNLRRAEVTNNFVHLKERPFCLPKTEKRRTSEKIMPVILNSTDVREKKDLHLREEIKTSLKINSGTLSALSTPGLSKKNSLSIKVAVTQNPSVPKPSIVQPKFNIKIVL